MSLPIIHDPADASCRCHYCCNARYLTAAGATRAEEEAAEEADAEARAAFEMQLRLPIAPLPHCAGQPSFLETYELQPELLS